MFTDEKTQGEQQPVKVGTLKLSEAIRIGKPIVGEEGESFRLCALGCAWAGIRGSIGGPDMTNALLGNGLDFSNKAIARRIGVHLGFDPGVCEVVSAMHAAGLPALRIASVLESRGL